MPSRSELMTVAEAMQQYGHTRNWWYEQIANGSLRTYDVPGERGYLLLRSEVDRFMQPKPRDASQDTRGAGGQTA